MSIVQNCYDPGEWEVSFMFRQVTKLKSNTSRSKQRYYNNELSQESTFQHDWQGVGIPQQDAHHRAGSTTFKRRRRGPKTRAPTRKTETQVTKKLFEQTWLDGPSGKHKATARSPRQEKFAAPIIGGAKITRLFSSRGGITKRTPRPNITMRVHTLKDSYPI